MDANAVIRLPEKVTFETAPAALEAAAGALGAGTRQVDLAACTEFDSSLIAVLLDLRRRAAAAGGSCSIGDPPANLRKLAALYGVDGLLFDQRN